MVNKSLRLFSIRCFEFYYHNRFGWFRFFGIGLTWKDILINGLTFGERYGYEKGLQICKWRIGYLHRR